MSIILDLPRFFHFELVDHQTEYWTSKLMENPVYIRYVIRVYIRYFIRVYIRYFIRVCDS
jgi:hypothetical protein